MTPEERSELIAKIAALPQQVADFVAPLSEANLTTQTIPGEWTVAQNVHHLADSHMNAFVRVKLMLTEEHPQFKPYDQDAWAATPDSDHATVEESINLLRGLHSRWVRLLTSLSEAQWQRTGFHPESQKVYTPEAILRTYAGHGLGHLDQMQRTLDAR